MTSTPFTQEHRPPAPADLGREIEVELANRLAGESAVSELVHVVLAIIATALVWPAVPNTQAFAWATAVSLAALLRGLLRARGRRDQTDPHATVQAIRLGVGLLTISWGFGLAFIGPMLPFDLLALLTIIMAGIVAGATIALLADPFSFRIMAGGLLLPIALAIAVNGSGHANKWGAVLVLIFGASMLVYYRRSHNALLRQIRMAQELRITTAQAEAERDRAERMVRIVEATTDLVIIASPDGRLTYVNQAGRAMIGIDADEDVSGMSFRDVAPERLHTTIERELIPTILRHGTWSGDSLILSRDGREIPVSAVAIAHRDANGKVDSISSVARDVTAQAAAHKAMEVARDAAEQIAAAKSAFLANTSHEIRTPLNGILGMVELLLDTELTAEQRRSAELIASSGETLLNTINDVLDLSKIEAGQMELEAAPFDLHHVVHSTVRLLISRAAEKNVELFTDIDADVPQHVVGDPHRLRQVLTNLVGNAVKFTHEGEVVVSVQRVAERDDHARVRIAVRDTGIGIPDEHLQRIFDPFRQVDTSTTRHYGGTGLGLSISRKLVSLMGGTLEVQSSPAQGSEFHFTVELAVAPEPPESQRRRVSMRGVRALVVDDHPVNRRILCDMLRWAGAEVRDADAVAPALDILRRAERDGAGYALVVSDVQMPGQDGFQLARELRADHSLSGIRVMLLTSASRAGDDKKCRELGVAAYMQKPVSRVELVEAALAALADRASRSQRRSLVTRIKLDESRPKLRILIAEDNPVNQEVAASMLRKRGHEVVIVDNGREAVDMAAHREFDVVLMDIHMPVMDGLSATKLIRAADKNTPVVALTASVSAEERERATAAGMNGYLAKPFKPHELFAIVEGWSVDEESTNGTQSGNAPVDLAGFNAMLNDTGIPEAGPKMIEMFLEDSPARVSEMLAAAESEDLGTVKAQAHRIASGAGTIFAQQLSDLLRETEHAASDGDLARARALAQRSADEFARVRAYLEKTAAH